MCPQALWRQPPRTCSHAFVVGRDASAPSPSPPPGNRAKMPSARAAVRVCVSGGQAQRARLGRVRMRVRWACWPPRRAPRAAQESRARACTGPCSHVRASTTVRPPPSPPPRTRVPGAQATARMRRACSPPPRASRAVQGSRTRALVRARTGPRSSIGTVPADVFACARSRRFPRVRARRRPGLAPSRTASGASSGGHRSAKLPAGSKAPRRARASCARAPRAEARDMHTAGPAPPPLTHCARTSVALGAIYACMCGPYELQKLREHWSI
jgi:hypothetical protein